MSVFHRIELYSAKCLELKRTHQSYARLYDTRNTYLNVVNTIVLFAVSLSQAFIGSADDNITKPVYSSILALSAATKTVQIFLKYETLSEQHYQAAKKYSALRDVILNWIIIKDTAEIQMLHFCSEQFGSLSESSPDVYSDDLEVGLDELDSVVVELQGIHGDSGESTPLDFNWANLIRHAKINM